MQTLLERKRHYIQLITQAHSLYLPDSAIAVKAAKALERLPEQVLFYLYHLAPKKQSETVFLLTREDVTICAQEMGMPPEVITDDVFYMVKKGVESGLCCWGDVMKTAISFALKS